MSVIFLEFIRYIIVGGISFLADYLLLWVLTEFLKVYYLISSAISFIFGLIINYTLSIQWVFNKRKLNSKNKEFIFFTLIGIAGLVLNQLSMWIFTEKLKIFYMYSKLISATIVLFFNFIARKYLLF